MPAIEMVALSRAGVAHTWAKATPQRSSKFSAARPLDQKWVRIGLSADKCCRLRGLDCGEGENECRYSIFGDCRHAHFGC